MAPSEDKFRLWYGRLVVAIFLALAATLLAIAAGLSPRRLWPVAGFLATAAGTAGYNLLARSARKRLMQRLRQSPTPVGVRLRKPFWLRAESMVLVLEFAGVVGAMVSAIGFPQVALGILLVLGCFMGFWSTRFSDPDLTIEQAGLRLHFGAAHFLVPWSSIRIVKPIGPDHQQMIRLGIADMDRIRDSVLPDTPRSRKRVRDAFGISRDEIMLMPWTAGLDGETLQRAIRDGQTGAGDRPN